MKSFFVFNMMISKNCWCCICIVIISSVYKLISLFFCKFVSVVSNNKYTTLNIKISCVFLKCRNSSWSKCCEKVNINLINCRCWITVNLTVHYGRVDISSKRWNFLTVNRLYVVICHNSKTKITLIALCYKFSSLITVFICFINIPVREGLCTVSCLFGSWKHKWIVRINKKWVVVNCVRCGIGNFGVVTVFS